MWLGEVNVENSIDQGLIPSLSDMQLHMADVILGGRHAAVMPFACYVMLAATGGWVRPKPGTGACLGEAYPKNQINRQITQRYQQKQLTVCTHWTCLAIPTFHVNSAPSANRNYHSKHWAMLTGPCLA